MGKRKAKGPQMTARQRAAEQVSRGLKWKTYDIDLPPLEPGQPEAVLRACGPAGSGWAVTTCECCDDWCTVINVANKAIVYKTANPVTAALVAHHLAIHCPAPEALPGGFPDVVQDRMAEAVATALALQEHHELFLEMLCSLFNRQVPLMWGVTEDGGDFVHPSASH